MKTDHWTEEHFRELLATAAAKIRAEFPQAPAFYLHFGAEFLLQGLFDETPQTLPLSELVPELPATPNPDGVAPVLRAGLCEGVPIWIATGSRRTSEGYGLLAALFPTALAAYAGVQNHIFLDTAVSLDPDLKTGKWGMLTDFVNDFAFSPLEGLRELLATPYPNLSETLSQVQNSEILNALAEFGEAPKLCTYHGVPGFQAPTPAEARRARDDGAEFLGHDLVLHLILSHAMGCRVSALALAGAQILPGRTPHFTREDLLETSRFCSAQLRKGLRQAIRELHAAACNGGYGENILPEADADELIRESIRKSATRTSPLKHLLKRE